MYSSTKIVVVSSNSVINVASMSTINQEKLSKAIINRWKREETT